jgi:hypothetical protein
MISGQLSPFPREGKPPAFCLLESDPNLVHLVAS